MDWVTIGIFPRDGKITLSKGAFPQIRGEVPFVFLEEWLMDGLIQHSETINKLLARYGVKFGIYKSGELKE